MGIGKLMKLPTQVGQRVNFDYPLDSHSWTYDMQKVYIMMTFGLVAHISTWNAKSAF